MKDRLNRFVKKSQFLSWIKYKLFCWKWKRMNTSNFTVPVNCFNKNKVHVGKGTYGGLDVRHFGADNEELHIGNYCSIGPECVFLLGGEHRYDVVSTYPFRMKYVDKKNESISKGAIIIEDDVWIGFRATLMSGIRVGKGAIIAAGSVVVKDVPEYSIVAGVPAKVIKYRFSDTIIDKIKDIRLDLLDEKMVKNKIKILEMKINEENVDDICMMLDK